MAIGVLVAGCSEKQQSLASPCVVTPPERTLADRESIVRIKADLEKATSSGALAADFKTHAEETFQKIGDSDAACHMLLRTLSCLNEGRSDDRVAQFVAYLRDTKACVRTQEATLKIDAVRQVFADDAFRFKYPPIIVEILARNSGDSPAVISEIQLHFDDHLRKPREPQNLTKLSTIYALVLDSTGARVKAQSFTDTDQPRAESPADAFYPDAVSPKLLVVAPVAQELGPRSSDRFQIQLHFTNGFPSRGPREQVKVVAVYNDGRQVMFGPIKLERQPPCLALQTVQNGKAQDLSFCR
jgi:hypothetical protein